MNKSAYIPLVVAAGLAAAGIGTAVAQNNATPAAQTEQTDAMELAALDAAKISLPEAIAAAEKNGAGKAVDAGFENEDGKAGYEVEVLGANGSQTLFVDAQTGAVTQVAADEQQDDDSDEGGEAGENGEQSEQGEDND